MNDEHYERKTKPCTLSSCCHKPVFERHLVTYFRPAGLIPSARCTDPAPTLYCSQCGERCQGNEVIDTPIALPSRRRGLHEPGTELDDYLASLGVSDA